MRQNRGFTLVELIIYIGIFSVAASFLISTMITAVKIENKEIAATEVNQQPKFILDTVQRTVSNSSLIEKTYEGTNESNPCSNFCALKLRDLTANDPTIIRSDANGVYLKQGSNSETNITNSKVRINSLVFAKNDVPGGNATVQVVASLTYISTSPDLSITRTLASAVGRVSAATFDSDILPDADATRSVGQIGPNLRWKDGNFSGNLTIGGNVGIGTTTLSQKLEVNGGLRLNTAVAKPTCDSSTRGTFWVVQSGAGVKDTVQVCAKDATDAYTWRTIY